MAFIGFGATINYGDTDNTISNAVGELLDITCPTLETDSVEVSNSSNQTIDKTFLGGLRDGGELTFELLLSDSEYTGLKNLGASSKWWEVAAPGGNGDWVFQGFVSSLGAAMPLADRCTCSVSVKVSGAVTFTNGS